MTAAPNWIQVFVSAWASAPDGAGTLQLAHAETLRVGWSTMSPIFVSCCRSTLQRMDLNPERPDYRRSRSGCWKSEALDLCLTDMQLPAWRRLGAGQVDSAVLRPVCPCRHHGSRQHGDCGARALKLGRRFRLQAVGPSRNCESWWQVPSSCRGPKSRTPACSDPACWACLPQCSICGK